MKNFLYLLTLTIISASCAKVEKTFTWTGEREVYEAWHACQASLYICRKQQHTTMT